MPSPTDRLNFNDISLDLASRRVFRSDREIILRDREFDLLQFLIQRAPHICSVDEIILNVWAETHVENNSVEKAIASIRKQLDDDPKEPVFIKTVRKRGYLFIGKVRSDDARDTKPQQIASRTDKSRLHPVRGSTRSRAMLTIGALVLVVGLVTFFGGSVWEKATRYDLLVDDFNSVELDPQRWTVSGNSVAVKNGVVKAECSETDNCGRLVSKFFRFDPQKPVTVLTRIKVHYQQHLKDETYFLGFFGLTFKRPNLAETSVRDISVNGIYYANYDYSSHYPNGEIDSFPVEGWFLFRGGAAPNKKVDYRDGRISARIVPKWDEWIDQSLVWNPETGSVTYFVNGELAGEFNFGEIPFDLVDNSVRIEVAPRGWWLYHSIELDSISVTQ